MGFFDGLTKENEEREDERKKGREKRRAMREGGWKEG